MQIEMDKPDCVIMGKVIIARPRGISLSEYIVK
jgi:hypothetical protein